jgi:hypothetical protein
MTATHVLPPPGFSKRVVEVAPHYRTELLKP